MLLEIICSKFKSHGEVRPAIRFHKGLNTVLGGKAADNSVGKSTFLLIVDFVFGGDTYKNSDAVSHIGNHTIKFAFQFGDTIYHFARNIVNASEVTVCDEKYNPIENIKINDFRKKLFDLYHIGLPYTTF